MQVKLISLFSFVNKSKNRFFATQLFYSNSVFKKVDIDQL